MSISPTPSVNPDFKLTQTKAVMFTQESSHGPSALDSLRPMLLREDFQAVISDSAMWALRSIRDVHRLESYSSVRVIAESTMLN